MIRPASGVLRFAPERLRRRTGSIPDRSINKTPGISRRQFPAKSNQLQPCSSQSAAIRGDT